MGRKRGNRKKENQAAATLKAFESDLFTCKVSPVYGRYLETKVDVKKGDLIHKEKCLVAGPKALSTITCIGCHSDMLKASNKLKCSLCKWPLCTPQCQKSPFHKQECSFLTEKKIAPPSEAYSTDYGAITILRGLLLKINQPDVWKVFSSLEHHNSVRKEEPLWKNNEERVAKLILETWDLKDMFTEEEIFAVCGIFEVNGFELGDYQSYGGVFPIAAMIAHECVPNSTQFENCDESALEVRAIVDIPAGSPITLCYDGVLKGTAVRQNLLKKSKYFVCSCKRCSDPTELGTNFSTLVCTNCKKASLMENLEDHTWVCSKCSAKAVSGDIENILTKHTSISDSLRNIKTQEEFLTECKAVFHPTHYIPFGVKFGLCMAYGRDEGYSIYELNTSEIHRKLALCNEVLKVLDILTPCNSVIRGNILYELQAAEVLIARNMMESGKCSKALVKRRLQNSMNTLLEAIEIFELSYPTKMLAKSARETTLVELRGWISSLKQ